MFRQRSLKEEVYEQQHTIVFVFYACTATAASPFFIALPAQFNNAEFPHRFIGGICGLSYCMQKV